MNFTLAARASAFTASTAALTTRASKTSARRARGGVVRVDAVAVEIRHEGETYTVEVADGDNILDVALDAGIDLRYDCKMGVCMMCPAKVVAGDIDQSGSMVSEDVAEAGYTLLCCAKPESDGVIIQTVSEDELLDAQFGA
jgi:ferredoxin